MTSPSIEDWLINQYSYRRLGNGFLVTTDHGSWVFLSKKMFADLRSENIESLPVELLKAKGIIVDKKSATDIMQMYKKKYHYLSEGVFRHVIVFVDGNRDMGHEVAKKTIDFIFQSPSKNIVIEFEGANASSSFDTVKYLTEHAVQKAADYGKDIRFILFVEKLIDDKWLAFCRMHNIMLNVSILPDKMNFLTVRKGLKINLVLEVKRDMLKSPCIIDKYYEIGAASILIKPLFGPEKARKEGNWAGCSAEEYLQFWKEALEYIVKKNKERVFIEKSTLAILNKITAGVPLWWDELRSPSSSITQVLAYDHKGNIYPCADALPYKEFCLGNTSTQRYEHIISSGQSRAMIASSINDNSVCRNCTYRPYCGLSPVGFFAETGNILPKIPDRRCRINMGMFDHIFMKLIYDEEYRDVFNSWITL